MILDFYNLREQPFGVTPDPRYLYLSPTHREALASVRYGFNADRGFTALIAKPGMGKTTLLFDFLNRVQGRAKTVFLFQWQSSPVDLLRNLLSDLGIEDDGGDMVRMHRALNKFLLKEHKEGRSLAVVVDEAQNLDEPVLEMLRMLSNFETRREKLMHLILAGQPQLADKLASPQLTQLRQRISIFARLKPLNTEDTKLYIAHRLSVAGYDPSRPLFTKRAEQLIAEQTCGIPRQINNVCFNAISLGCAGQQRTIDVDVIREVLDDLDLGGVCSEATTRKRSLGFKPLATSRGTDPKLSFPKWLFRVAAAITLLLLGSWPLASLNQRVTRGSRFEIEAGKPATTALTAQTFTKNDAGKMGEATSVESAAVPSAPKFTVIRAVPGDTLYRISIKAFGKYDAGVLAKIREENPWLRNPARITVGQAVRIPNMESTTQEIQASDDRVSASHDEELEKP